VLRVSVADLAANRHRTPIARDHDGDGMLEVRLHSGPVVAFDGRVVEVFAEGGVGRRFHISQLRAIEVVEGADGVRTLVLDDGAVKLAFAREQAPACARLLAAIAQARGAVDPSTRVG
jgi:hypothetical protein